MPDLPARHRTMRQAIEWSYDLLTPEQQGLFRRLGVFANGWMIEVAEHVCATDHQGSAATIVADLDVLVAASLVFGREAADGTMRLRFLETVREFALERLAAADEVDALRTRHAEYFVTWAEAAVSKLRGAEQVVWLARLAADQENLHAALGWAEAGGDAEQALRLTGALGHFWLLQPYPSDGERWLQRALELPESAGLHRLHALALAQLGMLVMHRGAFQEAAAALDTSLALARRISDAWGIATALAHCGWLAESQGQAAQAIALYQEALPICREIGDTWGNARCLLQLGLLCQVQGELDQGARLLNESLTLFRTHGDRWGIGWAMTGLGWVATDRGDLSRAAQFLEEALVPFRALDNNGALASASVIFGYVRWCQGDAARAQALYEESLRRLRGTGEYAELAWTLRCLGHLALAQGDRARARQWFADALAAVQTLGIERPLVELLVGLAALMSAAGDQERAVRWLGTVQAWRDATKIFLWGTDRQESERLLTAARAELSEAAFTAAWTDGLELAFEDAFKEAVTPMIGEPPFRPQPPE